MTVYEMAIEIGLNLARAAFRAKYYKDQTELKDEVEDTVIDLGCLLSQMEDEDETQAPEK